MEAQPPRKVWRSVFLACLVLFLPGCRQAVGNLIFAVLFPPPEPISVAGFPRQIPATFTRTDIEAIEVTPGYLGCYGLFKADVWVYVGCGDVRARLLAHLNGDDACISKLRPTRLVLAVASDTTALERRLLSEHQPVCNAQ